MKRRISWPRWLSGRRRAPLDPAPLDPAPTAAAPHPHPMPYRVLLRFRDGSSEILDPSSAIALEFHALADQWLAGHR